MILSSRLQVSTKKNQTDLNLDLVDCNSPLKRNKR